MGNLIVAIVIVVGGWWLLRQLGRSQPKQVRSLMRKGAGWLLMAAGALLTLRGAMNIGIPLVMLGLGFVGETALFPNGMKWAGGAQQPPPPPPHSPPRRPGLSPKEAYAVLGLSEGARADDVRAAHRRLMKDYHPDKGGSDYLAAKINEAKDVLLQELGATT